MNVVERSTIKDECATAMVLVIVKLTPMIGWVNPAPTRSVPVGKIGEFISYYLILLKSLTLSIEEVDYAFKNTPI